MAERKIVVIDAGHGGTDPGATYNGRQEKDDNLRLTLAVGKILADNGVDVRYTRTDDTYNTPLEKAMMANDAEADFLVSIHRNAMPVPGTGSGIETLLFEEKGDPAMLAKNIGERLSKVGFTNLGAMERPGLVVLRRTKIPTVLVEAGFIDNESDNYLFDQNFQAIAQAVAEGILNTLLKQEETRPEYYQLQTGAYRVRALAEDQVNLLKSQGSPAFVVFEDGLYKVRVGAFRNIDSAVSMEQALRRYGYNTFMVKRPAVF
ncbi:N-acetylmuramoyl-L-alanine amidase [Clostridium sp. Marseille-P2415]|uniref:N-acetylmuramoyl-L-alanine amidase n=1 Tax=Clostridium sp. Marseille-P2415 TaxID=1805471 RepID=UPI000988405D|nr:N-acetylmuramoyl-L-alanine amidase [Clostridium sp. Marseille-P2415]